MSEEEEEDVFIKYRVYIWAFVGFFFLLGGIATLVYFQWIPNVASVVVNPVFWAVILGISVIGLLAYAVRLKYIDLSNPFQSRQDQQLTERQAYELAYYELLSKRNTFPEKTRERGIEFEGVGDDDDENYNRIFRWEFRSKFGKERVVYLMDLEQPVNVRSDEFDVIDHTDLERKIDKIQNRKVLYESDWSNFEEKVEESIRKMAKNVRLTQRRTVYSEDRDRVEEIETPVERRSSQPAEE